MNKLLFVSLLLILPISCFADTKLIIQTSGDKEFVFETEDEKEILMQSQTIKNIIEDLGGSENDDEEDQNIPLTEISEKTFEQIMECLKPLAEIEKLKIQREELEGADKTDKELEIEDKKAEVDKALKSYNEDDLFNLIQAASYLDVPPLLDYACAIWSDSYELSRFKNKAPLFDNQEIIEKLKNINLLPVKSFFIKKYFENYTPGVQKLDGHEKAVNSVCYSPDGTRLVSGLGDGTVRIWNVATDECLKVLDDHKRSVNSVCYSPDGTKLASGSWDGTVRIWGVAKGKCLKVLKGHEKVVNSVCYSPDGKQLASGSQDKTVRIWGVAKGECLKVLKGHAVIGVNSVCYSPGGTHLASGSQDKTVRIWDMVTGKCLKVLDGHEDVINAVCYSPDGTQLASGSNDHTVRIWDMATGECLKVLKGHADEVRSVCYSPDGTQLASGSQDKIVRIWDIGDPIKTLDNQDYTQILLHRLYKEMLENNEELDIASNSHLLKIFNSMPPEQQELLKEITRISCLADTKLIIQTSGDKKLEFVTKDEQKILMQSQTIKHMIDAFDNSENDDEEDQSIFLQISEKTFEQIMECLKPLAEIEKLKIQREGLEDQEIEDKKADINKTLKSYNEDDLSNLIQAASYLDVPQLLDYACAIWSDSYELSRFEDNNFSFDNVEIIEKLKNINLSSVKSFLMKKYFESYSPDLKIVGLPIQDFPFAVSPDRKRAVSAPDDALIAYISDIETKQFIKELKGHEAKIKFLCYNPDGSQVASGSEDKTIRIWDAHTGECFQVLEGHEGAINAVCYSPDGNQIASASDDKLVLIWDISTGLCSKIYQGHWDSVTFVCYSPDGTQIASSSSDQTVWIWDAKTLNYLKILQGHKGVVNFVCYNPDGMQIASASSDEAVRIWDVNKGVCLKILASDSEDVSSLCYSPDGTDLAFCAPHRETRVWHIGKPVKDVEQLSNQQLLLHKLCKKNIKNRAELDIVNKPHLASVFNSMPLGQQELLKRITPMKLSLTKQILLRLYEYKKPIAAVGFTGLALYAGWKMLQN